MRKEFMKFFEKRDLLILHSILTIILLIGLFINSIILGIFYSDYIKNFDSQKKLKKIIKTELNHSRKSLISNIYQTKTEIIRTNHQANSKQGSFFMIK